MYFITGKELQVESKIMLLKLVFVILAKLKLFNSSFDEKNNSFKWPFSQNLIKSLYLLKVKILSKVNHYFEERKTIQAAVEKFSA